MAAPILTGQLPVLVHVRQCIGPTTQNADVFVDEKRCAAIDREVKTIELRHQIQFLLTKSSLCRNEDICRGADLKLQILGVDVPKQAVANEQGHINDIQVVLFVTIDHLAAAAVSDRNLGTQGNAVGKIVPSKSAKAVAQFVVPTPVVAVDLTCHAGSNQAAPHILGSKESSHAEEEANQQHLNRFHPAKVETQQHFWLTSIERIHEMPEISRKRWLRMGKMLFLSVESINSEMRTRKTVLLMLLVGTIWGLTGCKATKEKQQKPSATRELPALLATAYREDAARLAVREYNTTTQTGERIADIPTDRINYYFELLSKVYWMCVDTDTIPDLSIIHTRPTPNLRQVNVVLEKDSPFKENWSKGITMTNNLYLNQLIAKYKLVIKNYQETSIGPSMIFESPTPINTRELAFLFKNFETIRTAESAGIVGDGNDITWGTDSKNAMAIRYSIGAGDCPSGCTQRKIWTFYVLQDGSIQYMGARGSIPKESEPK